jgi:DtxR family Mn-dependent transcriptional regulator
MRPQARLDRVAPPDGAGHLDGRPRRAAVSRARQRDSSSHWTRMTTPAVEDYLKAIYQLGDGDRPVSTSAIADRLAVAAGSVTGMVKRLAEQGLVEHVPYHGATLTAEGRANALRLIRRHRVIELFLVEVMNYTWDRVHEEAERLEHAASDELIDRMALLLGEPHTDPHGSPIPEPDGRLHTIRWPTLADLETGRAAVLRRVRDADPAALRYLADLGLMPGAGVAIVERAPFNGPLTVRVGSAEHVLGRELCGTILVEPTD